MRTPELDCHKVLERAVAFLQAEAQPCYLVGGYVRDRLLEAPARDLDVAVAGDAVALARRLADATGGAFYVLDEATEAARIVYRPRPDGFVVDVAAMRGPDIVADLRDRDLTINAMAIGIDHCLSPNPPIIDPCAGRQDLVEQTVRATGDQAFLRDPVRMLRALRFSATLGFRIDRQTEAWIRRDADNLASTSAERKRDEFAHVVAASSAADHLRRMEELGLLRHVLPEVTILKGVPQAPPHIHDVYEHTLAAVAQAERLVAGSEPRLTPDERRFLLPYAEELAAHFGRVETEGRLRSSWLKLCALLHDVAKPMALQDKESGVRRAARHAEVGAEMAAQALRRLRFSAREIRLACKVIAHHMRPGLMLKSGPLNLRGVYRFFRDTGDAGIDVIVLALADQLATRGPTLEKEHWRDYLALAGQLLEHYFHKPGEAVSPPVLINGRDVLSVLRVRPGPLVGQALEEVREAQAEGLVRSREEALDFVRGVRRRS